MNCTALFMSGLKRMLPLLKPNYVRFSIRIVLCVKQLYLSPYDHHIQFKKRPLSNKYCTTVNFDLPYIFEVATQHKEVKETLKMMQLEPCC